MAMFHTRSNSFPSKSSPALDDIRDHLCRLKSSQNASTSATSLCANLASLRDLREGINNLIRMPSIQQANKKVKQCIKNLRSFNQNSAAILDREDGLEAIQTILKETEALDFSVVKSALLLLSGEKERSSQRSWPFPSKLTQTRRVYSEAKQGNAAEDLCSLNIRKSQKRIDNVTAKNMPNQLNSSEVMIQELDEGLESLFRSLVKTGVSLPNVLSHY